MPADRLPSIRFFTFTSLGPYTHLLHPVPSCSFISAFLGIDTRSCSFWRNRGARVRATHECACVRVRAALTIIPVCDDTRTSLSSVLEIYFWTESNTLHCTYTPSALFHNSA